VGIQDDEILRQYVEESLEHLADIENDLLLMEEAGEDIDEELVNKVFRAAHSVKGGAGFMALDNIKGLAHKTENVLGMIRGRELAPNAEVVNILLMAFDRLREMLDNAERSGEADVSEYLVALDGLTCAALPPEEKESVSKTAVVSLPDGRAAFTLPEFDLLRVRKEGKHLYLVEYDLVEDVHEKGRTPLDIIASMEESGEILDCRLSVGEVGTLEDSSFSCHIPFVVLFATIIDPDVIEALFEIDSRRIHSVDESHAAPAPTAGGRPEEEGAPPVRDEVVAEAEPEYAVEPDADAAALEVKSPSAPEKASVADKPSVPSSSAQQETSLRVHVSLLDSLMTLAGELVLSRNQLIRSASSRRMRSLQLACQKIDLVTSELQEAIMRTRMQPIANIFNKFPRVVRDLARHLGKEARLSVEGREVELDKTILEGLSDPLTHLVRNSVDHGIEPPGDREGAGKEREGHVRLRAYHEGGQVNIEISDDGKGVDGEKVAAKAVARGLLTEERVEAMSPKEKVHLIFLPGFSTAEEVTDVSGRGVGMDVVRTNLNRLGGQVDVESEPGAGCTVRIKLPLTLAIIPSLLVSAGGERYAIPQVNLDELLRIPAHRVKERVEVVGDVEVVRLREKLLPLLALSDVLGVRRTYREPETGEEKPDRRRRIADRRSPATDLGKGRDPREKREAEEGGSAPETERRRRGGDRRHRPESAVNIAVVSAGALKYGLVVDELHDSEDIVVKPLGRHLKKCRGYAGATILGDGRVALILDVATLARMAELTSVEEAEKLSETAREAAVYRRNLQSLLVFRNAEEERFAVPLGLVARVEQIRASSIERTGGRRVVQYRGGVLPLIALEEAADVGPLAEREKLLVIVFAVSGREAGLLAVGPVDAVEASVEVDTVTLRQTGIMGSAVVEGHTTLLVDVFELVEALHPQWLRERPSAALPDGRAPAVLLAEDSDFFREQVKHFMEEEGYRVVAAEDGLEAWTLLREGENDISLVVTDIEMPRMDGYELCRRIRADERLRDLPVIALTSLAGDEDVARGKAAGIDEYQIKLDRETVLRSVHRLLSPPG